MITDGLIEALKADTGVAAIVADKVFPGVAGSDAGLPYVVVTRVDHVRETNLHDGNDLNHPRVQVDGYARTAKLCRAIERALLFDPKEGPGEPGLVIRANRTLAAGGVVAWGGLELQCVRVDNVQDLFEADASGKEQGTHRVSIDLIIWHKP